jgi:hypothetical protein
MCPILHHFLYRWEKEDFMKPMGLKGKELNSED